MTTSVSPDTNTDTSAVNGRTMLLGLAPWLLFSVIVHRYGAAVAWPAALAAAGFAAIATIRHARSSSAKIVDIAGVAIFTVLAVAGYLGSTTADNWVANFGRGASAVALAAVMLVSAVTVPFTEQYARESVPRDLWLTPPFRAVNRRTSTLWGGAVLVMGVGHLVAGLIDPVSDPQTHAHLIGLVLNWAVPALVITVAVKLTAQLADQPR